MNPLVFNCTKKGDVKKIIFCSFPEEVHKIATIYFLIYLKVNRPNFREKKPEIVIIFDTKNKNEEKTYKN